MNLADSVFIGLAVVTVLGALGAVAFRALFYNALSLVLCLFGVAGLFIYLHAEFLAVMEVIIYIGAISVAIIFAIMLSRPMDKSDEPRSPSASLRGAVCAALVFAGLWRLLSGARWAQGSGQLPDMRDIGKALLTTDVLPFEAVSLVLLVAIIGALVLSSPRERS
ncbi:MAG: hypothetical protein MOGMAGMI_00573 [Candidatus Omnitrophica bacterium]|nr:hypothetical protein [Candidatus Omnitrophota bacterium]